MGLLGSLVIRYAAEGHHDVIRADKRVRDSLSTTARHAKRDEAATKGWMQRHMTALLAVAGTIGAAMYTIARESPSMSAAIGEIRLAFSMFFMDVGERAAPFFEGLADLAGRFLEEWEKLPDSMKDALVGGMPAILENWGQLFADLAATADRYLGTEDTFQTLAQKILDTWDWLKKNAPLAVSAMFTRIGEEWGKFREDPIAWGADLVTQFVTGVRNLAPALYNYVIGVLGTVAGKFLDWLPGAWQWGVDLMNNFIGGIRSMFAWLDSTIATIKSKIEAVMSFDISANDRMAYRWGSDLVQHFEAGMRSVQLSPVLPVASPAPVAVGAGGGISQTVYVDIGGITVSGAAAQSPLDERKIARMVRDEIGQALRSRGR
ncbi:hypothetical protein [Methanoculleus thermophilus]|uniref:Phage-related protein n=1 Tax=Methanoculleus thermophilus TaxID=2200 RepID=A0A1G8Z0R5_9EURY|nr:hypothetical protein [Methanoculleus thermophilus]SDK07810.1 hypothetical protein SAMN04488571_103270 [Methanoculleus thermophilus]